MLPCRATLVFLKIDFLNKMGVQDAIRTELGPVARRLQKGGQKGPKRHPKRDQNDITFLIDFGIDFGAILEVRDRFGR